MSADLVAATESFALTLSPSPCVLLALTLSQSWPLCVMLIVVCAGRHKFRIVTTDSFALALSFLRSHSLSLSLLPRTDTVCCSLSLSPNLGPLCVMLIVVCAICCAGRHKFRIVWCRYSVYSHSHGGCGRDRSAMARCSRCAYHTRWSSGCACMLHRWPRQAHAQFAATHCWTFASAVSQGLRPGHAC